MNQTSKYTATKQPCESCNSSDAVAHYADGGSKCFSCGVFKHTKDKKALKPKTLDELKELEDYYQPMPLPARKISYATCKKYDYLVGNYKGKFNQVAVYRNSKGEICAHKFRGEGKQFFWQGKGNSAALFGQHLFTPNDKLSITITEGELDALSIAEITDCKWPVVSIPSGAQSAKKVLQDQFTYLNGFKEIRLCFDADKEGQAAIEACLSIPFTPGKLKVITLPDHDASDMLQNGRVAELQAALWNAQVRRPDCIVNSKDIDWDVMLAPVAKGWTTPYPKLDELMNGILPRRLYMISAGFGAGKTTFMKELAYCLRVKHDLKIASIHLEEGFQETVLSYICLDNNIAINSILEDPKLLGMENVEKSKKKLYNEGKMSFYKHFGSDSVDKLLQQIEYFAVAEEVDIIILDHVTAAVSGLSGGNEGDRKTIDKLLDGLRTLIQRTGVTVIAAVQLVKSQKDKGPNDGGKIALSDVRGSGQVAGTADVCIALEGDQQGKSPNTRTIRILKNRISGRLGLADHLAYNNLTGRLLPDLNVVKYTDEETLF